MTYHPYVPLEYTTIKFAAKRVNELGDHLSKLLLEPPSDRRDEKTKCTTALRDQWMENLLSFKHVVGLPKKD